MNQRMFEKRKSEGGGVAMWSTIFCVEKSKCSLLRATSTRYSMQMCHGVHWS